jgi:hypothetical protein
MGLTSPCGRGRTARGKFLNEFLVNAPDRKYQFWKRNSLSIDLRSNDVFMQKLDYIHNNPNRKNGSWRNYPGIIDTLQPAFIWKVLTS